MAKSIDTYFSEIVAAKQAKIELQDLDSDSATAIWRLWAFVTATCYFIVDSMFDLFRVEITTLLNTLKPGTLLWYRQMCLDFQYGDNLQWIAGKWQYAAIDVTKRIIKQCSVTEGMGGLVIKIATESAGEWNPLSQAQYDAFVAYIARIKYAGTRISIVNSPANLLKLQATIYYDPLIIAADGKRITDQVPVFEVAANDYLKELPFNGRFKNSSLQEKLLAVEGSYDIKLQLVQQKYGTNAYASIDPGYTPESGYFKIDLAFPLSAQFTYIANV